MFYNFDLINNFNILLSINSINSTYNILIFILLSLFSAIFLDIIYGELPTKIHPVVFIGSIISFFKNIFINKKQMVWFIFNIVYMYCFNCIINYIILFIFI